MSAKNMIRLNIPRQDLAEFTLFPPNTAAAQGWAQALPIANTARLVELLSQALDQLNRFRLPPEVRFGILETLRPHVDVALSSLAKRFLNQPLIMPPEPQRLARDSDRLHALASTGYGIVAVEGIAQRDAIRNTNPAQLACQSIHRALCYAGGRLLQSLQLSQPLPAHAWRELHQLYALGELQELTVFPVPDHMPGARTIRTTYLQSLLLGCCKPDQLRQRELVALYAGLGIWSVYARISADPRSRSLFMVDLQSDNPAQYRALDPDKSGPGLRFIDTVPLVAQLEQIRGEGGSPEVRFDNDLSLPGHILDHLVTALGSTSLRHFNRRATDSEVAVCVGLSSTHYHVAGRRAFDTLVYGNEYNETPAARRSGNPFMTPIAHGDVWQQANPEVDYARELPVRGSPAESDLEHSVNVDALTRSRLLEEQPGVGTDDDKYPVYRVKLADTSPGGYCLQWTSELPGDIRPGDIVGLRERPQADWAIAVIRWMRRTDGGDSLIGVELLSPRAVAYGAAIQTATGSKAPLRALLLPEIKLVGQPETLVTPRIGFRERQKITLGNSAEKCSVQLLRQLSASGSFSRFSFRYTRELGDVLAENRQVTAATRYDSIWSNI